jgi:TolB-like protein
MLAVAAVYSFAPWSAQTDRPEHALAVLPFDNMSSEPGDSYFSDGLTEQIISVLSRIPELHVVARTSSFALRDSKLDIRAIADTLDVNVILEGSVRREGHRLRVTAQLIDAVTGFHVWSGDYDREMRQIVETQDEIAADIARALELRMPVRAAQIPKRQPNLQAYDLYLRALYLRDRFSPEALSQAREYLDRAIELDPSFAQAYALKATVLGPAIFWQYVPLASSTGEARAARVTSTCGPVFAYRCYMKSGPCSLIGPTVVVVQRVIGVVIFKELNQFFLLRLAPGLGVPD